MTVPTRARSTNDARDRHDTPGGRGGRPYRGYGAYTSGANALRLDTVEPEIDDDAAAPITEPRVAPRPSRKPQPARVPRPRRRTPWVTDVTPAPPPDAPALPMGLPKAPFVALLVGLVVVGVVGVLVLHTKINEGSFRLSDLRSTQAVLDQQEQQLEQQLADLSQPGNLRAAATRLGLVPAGDPAHIYLPDGRVVGVPQPAVP